MCFGFFLYEHYVYLKNWDHVYTWQNIICNILWPHINAIVLHHVSLKCLNNLHLHCFHFLSIGMLQWSLQTIPHRSWEVESVYVCCAFSQPQGQGSMWTVSAVPADRPSREWVPGGWHIWQWLLCDVRVSVEGREALDCTARASRIFMVCQLTKRDIYVWPLPTPLLEASKRKTCAGWCLFLLGLGLAHIPGNRTLFLRLVSYLHNGLSCPTFLISSYHT